MREAGEGYGKRNSDRERDAREGKESQRTRRTNVQLRKKYKVPTIAATASNHHTSQPGRLRSCARSLDLSKGVLAMPPECVRREGLASAQTRTGIESSASTPLPNETT